MPLVTLKDIHLVLGNDLFNRLKLKIYKAEKIGLIGPNGCGKSTLLNIILGIVQPDVGEVRKRKSLRIGYLPQEPQFNADKTALEELHGGAESILRLQKKLQAAAENIGVLSGSELKSSMSCYDRLNEEFELLGGYEYETRIKQITTGLGLEEKSLELKISQLSGGQLSRLGLAHVLLADAELLLLDEPTNHLDFEATLWLEKFLKNFQGAAIIVSHDRFLLDRLCSKIIEINNQKADTYSGNYTNYKLEKEKQNLEYQRKYQQQTEFIAKTRDFIARNRNQVGMRKVARGRQKHLDKLLKLESGLFEKPKHDKTLKFSFKQVKAKSQRLDSVLTFTKVTKKFNELTLFKELSFELLAGQRLGIIGPNGTGKTTLLKLALGKNQTTSGSVQIGKGLSVGYLDQAGLELNPNNSVLEEIGLERSDMLPEQLRTRLGSFMFSEDDVFKKVGKLSGGEKNRLALCKLVLAEPEILILDEPTNHLDIPSTEALEDALQNYKGTIITVSHDRYFLEKTVDHLLTLGTDETGKKAIGQHEFVVGSFNRYAELLEERAQKQNQKEKKTKTTKLKRPRQMKAKTKTPPELRQFNSWTIEKIEQAIEEAEKKLDSLHEQFGEEKIYKNHKLLHELQAEFSEIQQCRDLLYRAYELKTG